MVKSTIMTLDKFGRYEIKSELGRGGFGTVYHAHDPRFKRDVALKVLPPQFLHDQTFKARFEREAQTVAALEHAAIVPVYDYGEQDNQPYLVMRYLAGGTLTQRLQHGALDLAEVIRITSRLAPALNEAHKQGIVHRDLKPDNILFDHRNAPFITDFGLVKLTQGSDSLTSGNVIVGTPAYMSPEQARGESDIDGRSDIYALGVILFQMLSGQLPYQADTPIGLIMQHITEPVPHIMDANPNLPSGCAMVIACAMAKEPNDRYETATDLAQSLIQFTQSPSLPASKSSKLIDSPSSSVTDREVIQTLPDQQTPNQETLATPTPQIKALTCPNCTTPLPDYLDPNQAVECHNCGSRFIMALPETSIICSRCQTNNADSLQFCTNCGQQLQLECVACHTKNQTEATHCINCGTNLKNASKHRYGLQYNRQQMQKEREQALKQKQVRQLQEKIERLISELSTPGNHKFALYQFNQIGDPAINALCHTLLTHDNTHARYGAAQALGSIAIHKQTKTFSKAKACKTLIKALSDSEASVRFYSAAALGNFKGKQTQQAIEPLAALLKDRHNDIRKQARASLKRIGGEQAQQILKSSKGFKNWLKGG